MRSLCPSFNTTEQITRHLFCGHWHPTSLGVKNLWHRPVRTAALLSALLFLLWLPKIPIALTKGRNLDTGRPNQTHHQVHKSQKVKRWLNLIKPSSI